MVEGYLQAAFWYQEKEFGIERWSPYSVTGSRWRGSLLRVERDAVVALEALLTSDEHVRVPVDHEVVPHTSDVQVGLDDELNVNEVVGPLSHAGQPRHRVQAVGDEMLLDVACDVAPHDTGHLNLPHPEPARHNQDVRDMGGVGDVKAVHVVVDVDHFDQGVDVEVEGRIP